MAATRLHLNISKVTRDMLMQHNLVVFGLAGTLIDYGRRCNINAFMNAFNDIGIKNITEQDIKHDIGIDIYSHVSKLLNMPKLRAEYIKANMREPCRYQINDISDMINANIMSAIDCNSVTGPNDATLTQWLHSQGIMIGVTTEYNMNVTERIMKNLEYQGVHIDKYVASDEVRIGRPEAWQAKMLMKKLGVNHYDVNGLKIGDTVTDIIEGAKLGFTTCNVTMSSGEMGFNKYELSYLPREFINYKNLEIRRLWESYACNMYVTDIEELEKIWCGEAVQTNTVES
jgi:phosphonoacetaldehyde hydrolase